MALGSVRTPKMSDKWDVVIKVYGCEKDELVTALKTLEGQELIDIRESTVFAT